MNEYDAALAEWKSTGGPRPHLRPDGVPTRADLQWMSEAERAILAVVAIVEKSGASTALTDAVILLGKARAHVADHVEAMEP